MLHFWLFMSCYYRGEHAKDCLSRSSFVLCFCLLLLFTELHYIILHNLYKIRSAEYSSVAVQSTTLKELSKKERIYKLCVEWSIEHCSLIHFCDRLWNSPEMQLQQPALWPRDTGFSSAKSQNHSVKLCHNTNTSLAHNVIWHRFG